MKERVGLLQVYAWWHEALQERKEKREGKCRERRRGIPGGRGGVVWGGNEGGGLVMGEEILSDRNQMQRNGDALRLRVRAHTLHQSRRNKHA